MFPLFCFFAEKPADLYDQLNPDWAPTVNMGHIRAFMTQSPSKSRYNRSQNLSLTKQHTASALSLLEVRCSTPDFGTDDTITSETESGTSSQTDIDSKLFTAMESELLVLPQENRDMKEKLEAKKFYETFFKNDDSKV